MAGPDAVIHVEGEPVPVHAILAPDVESIGRANAGYQRKYADSPYLGTMTREEILGTTLRLEPRSQAWAVARAGTADPRPPAIPLAVIPPR